MSDYRIRLVDAGDEEVADHIHALNGLDADAFPRLRRYNLEDEHCYWWLAYHISDNYWEKAYAPDEVVGFAGMTPAFHEPESGYFIRVLVMPEHQGHGLQRRFMRALERKARAVGWKQIVSDTKDTVYSANNFVRMGYEMYEPKVKWAFNSSIYWKKQL